MAENKKTALLKVRAQVKKRKPTYKRSQSHQFAKLDDGKYRAPKGMGNKNRRNRRGKLATPQTGYSSPKAVRGLNKQGLLEVLVHNAADLAKITSKEMVATIARTVGARKRLEILEAAKKQSLNIQGVKDLDAQIKKHTKEKKVAPKKAKKVEDKKEDAKEDKKADSKEDKK